MSISQKQAKKILADVDLPENKNYKNRKLATAPKTFRQTLIRQNPQSDEARTSAAIEIQRAYRGYCTRCRLLNAVNPQISHTAVYSQSKHVMARLGDVRTPSPEKKTGGISQMSKSSGRERLEQYYENYVSRMAAAGTDPNSPTIMSFQDFCANYIQSWWSKNKKITTSSNKSDSSKSSKSLRPIRFKPAAKKKREGPPSEAEACTIIQRAWRRHIDMQVYRYYKDLINFKARGDPGLMLRCINPKEAELMDAAMGVHIKFRLAGERFPPNIYYKIYTHRPVQDLCANSPKDYTMPDSKRCMARDVHNKGNRVPEKSKEGWYQRSENNGWRLVSDRLIHHMMSDPVTWESSRKKIEFNHSKLQRKADIEKKKKRKKIEWMQKMYKNGMLQAKTNDEHTRELVEGAAAGMVATIDAHGCNAVEEWEVDELLEWTTNLNFEDYIHGWKEIATSASSEKPMEERLTLFSGQHDPFELTISGGPSRRDGSTRQSHNTPVSSRSASCVN